MDMRARLKIAILDDYQNVALWLIEQSDEDIGCAMSDAAWRASHHRWSNAHG
jgi:hypothetical protein